MAYSFNPHPQGGSGAFGSVPGVLSPPDPYGDLTSKLPKLPSLNSAAQNDILSNLEGTLSAGTEHALQNASATYGAASGMPGSGLSWNSLYGNIAGASENQQARGLQEYDSFLPTVAHTQTLSPELQTEIAGTNASNAAAPNPGASASYAQQLFQQYLDKLKNPASGGSTIGSPANGSGSSNPYSVQSYNTGAFSSLGDASGQDASQYAGG